MKRKAVSLTSEAWLPVLPQATRQQKEIAHFYHSVLPTLLSTLRGGSFASSQSSMLLLNLPRIRGDFGLGFFCFFIFKVKLECSLTVGVGLKRKQHLL